MSARRLGAPWLLVAAMLIVTGSPGQAQEVRRALSESREVKAALGRISVNMLKQDAALKDCLPRRHLSTDAVDWACKVGALRSAAAQETVAADLAWEKNKGLQQRARLVSLGLDAADSLGLYRPMSAPDQNLPRWKVSSQAEACRAVQELYALMLDMPDDKPPVALSLQGFPEKVAPRLAGKSLRRVACDCHEQTLRLGRAGFLSEREDVMANAQKQVFSLKCNLHTTGRESSLVGLKKERSDVDFSKHGGSARGADVDRDDAQRIADRRKAELRLCIDADARGPNAADKMMRCACPLMQRWRFPKREVESPIVLKVAISDKLTPVSLAINNRGIVESCYLGDTPPPPAEPEPALQPIAPPPPPPAH